MAYLVVTDDERVGVKPRFREGLPFKFVATFDKLYQVSIQARRDVHHAFSVWQVPTSKVTHRRVAAFMSSLRIK